MSRYGRYYFSSDYINNINRMKKKDRKKAEFFADITRDNKIKKSEAEELLDRGYTRADLERYDSRTFNAAQEYYKEGGRAGEYYGNLNYSPLTISRGAGNLFSNAMAPPKPDPGKGVTITDPGYPPDPKDALDSETPTNNYQSQIDTLLEQISTDRTAAEAAAKERQAAFDKTIADMTAGFNTRTAELQAGFQSQMLAADQQRQAEIREIMSANQAQMDRMAAAQRERQQQMQIAAQTQAANAARAGQTGQFKVGGDRAIGGIGQFKRRLQIKPMTSAALSIAGGKSPGNNKMLNV